MPRHWTLSCGTNLGVASLHQWNNVWDYWTQKMTNMPHYVSHLLKSSTRFLERSRVLLFEGTKNLPTIKDESPRVFQQTNVPMCTLKRKTWGHPQRWVQVGLSLLQSFERFRLHRIVVWYCFPKMYRNLRSHKNEKQIWKKVRIVPVSCPLLLKMVRVLGTHLWDIMWQLSQQFKATSDPFKIPYKQIPVGKLNRNPASQASSRIWI